MLENYQKNILKILKIRFGTQKEPCGRSFLLPDGSFLKTDEDKGRKNEKGEIAYKPHYTIDNFLGNCIFDYLGKSYEEWRKDDEEEKRKKEELYNLTKKDFEEIYNNVDWDKVGNQYGSPILEEMGAIRLNGYEEHYIVLPNIHIIDQISNAQLNSLTLWLDKFANWNNKDFIRVMSNEDSWEIQEQNYPSNDVDYIIKQIKKYYTTGKLTESLSESGELINVSLTKELKEKLIEKLKEEFKVSKVFTGNSCYLFPDGTYLDVGDAHLNVEFTVIEFLFNNKLIDDEEANLCSLKESFVEIELNCIHCGNDHYKYLAIYKQNQPTTEQYNALKSYDNYQINHHWGYTIEAHESKKLISTTIYYNNELDTLCDKYGHKTAAKIKIRTYYETGKFFVFEENKKSLKEATRNQLLSKSKNGASYKDQNKGSRWLRKSKCQISTKVENYNKIDMNTFWKKDLLSFKLEVVGETDTYEVTIEFNNILNNIQKEVKNAHNAFNRDIVFKALTTSINEGQLKYNCNCKDFQYRLSYFASKNGYKAGAQETRVSDETNPDDKLGAACKHILYVLNNSSWLRNIASVIVNYANYCKDNMEYNYAKYIFPKIFNMQYEKAFDLYKKNIEYDLKTDEATINLSNALGKIRGRIKKGSNKNPIGEK